MKQRNRKLACLCIAGALLTTAGVYQSNQDTENTTTAVAREYAVENEVNGARAGAAKLKEQRLNVPESDADGLRAGAVASAGIGASEDSATTSVQIASNEVETVKQSAQAETAEGAAIGEEAFVEGNIQKDTAEVDSSQENNQAVNENAADENAPEQNDTNENITNENNENENTTEDITTDENASGKSIINPEEVETRDDFEEVDTKEPDTEQEEKEQENKGQDNEVSDTEGSDTEESDTEGSDAEESDAEEPEQVEEPQPEVVVAQVSNYVNVRNVPGVEGEILGKLYNDSVGTVLTEEGEWLRINSGNVEGYVKAEFVLRGEEGKVKADEVGTRLAKVATETLRVRQEATTESDIVTLIPQEDVYTVHEEVEGWAKIAVADKEGFVSTDYVELYTENTFAESREEEEARLRREEEQRQAEEAARQAAEAAARAEQQRAQAASGRQNKAPSGGNSAPAPNTSNGSLGQNIANYALQFVGNPYVYGGTSLTNGADCSGFVMSVYKNFGISLPRTSGEQGNVGTNVGGLGNAVPGDLVSYSGHIGIYIGNGQIVHASTAKTGIKISNASYRPILSVRRIV